MKPFFDPETDCVVEALQKCETVLALMNGFLSEIPPDDETWQPDRAAFKGLGHITREVGLALREIVEVVQMKHVEEMVRMAEEKRAEAHEDSAASAE